MTDAAIEHAHEVFDVGLPAGSVVIERYKPIGSRVQWLSQVVQIDGSLRLYAVCRTRHEALVEADRRG